MWETSISVWFVCRLCRGSFGQVDAFIEHKKQKHFTQFQNTTSIVFEERELGLLHPVITNNGDHQLADESDERQIKIEVNDDDPIIPFASEIIEEPNLDLVEPKSELIIFESELNPANKNNFFGLKQPEKNPFVLLKRLTSEEIQRACAPQRPSKLLKREQKNFANSVDPRNSSDDDSNNINNHNEVKNPTENQPSTTFVNSSTVHDLQLECKLCSKQLQSAAQLKIHVGICALYHKDRNRFCVTCSRKFCDTNNLKYHRLRFHGTEVEKLSLYRFKCHVCPKKYRQAFDLRFHLQSHNLNKQEETSNSKLLKCSHPNCEKEFRFNSELQRHITSFHLGLRPFSCSFPNCNKAFSQRGKLNVHIRIHTGERPFNCTVDNCKKAFTSSDRRSKHHRTAHRSL